MANLLKRQQSRREVSAFPFFSGFSPLARVGWKPVRQAQQVVYTGAVQFRQADERPGGHVVFPGLVCRIPRLAHFQQDRQLFLRRETFGLQGASPALPDSKDLGGRCNGHRIAHNELLRFPAPAPLFRDGCVSCGERLPAFGGVGKL